MRAPHRRHCMDEPFDAGDVFEHPGGVHNFIAGPGGGRVLRLVLRARGLNSATDPGVTACRMPVRRKTVTSRA